MLVVGCAGAVATEYHGINGTPQSASTRRQQTILCHCAFLPCVSVPLGVTPWLRNCPQAGTRRFARDDRSEVTAIRDHGPRTKG